jgi:hypothetical protein
MNWFLTLALLAGGAFQVWVSRRVWRSELFQRSEKFAQLRLIWLLPILGATMVYSVITEEDDHGKPGSHLSG